MVTAAPPPPVPLVLTAPAEREVSFGRIAGRLPRGKWAVVVRADGHTLAVRQVTAGSFDFVVSLPRREITLRVTAYSSGHAPERAIVEHVVGLPRSAAPKAVRGTLDAPLALKVRALAGSFPGT